MLALSNLIGKSRGRGNFYNGTSIQGPSRDQGRCPLGVFPERRLRWGCTRPKWLINDPKCNKVLNVITFRGGSLLAPRRLFV